MAQDLPAQVHEVEWHCPEQSGLQKTLKSAHFLFCNRMKLALSSIFGFAGK
jgi:hypothetical protein